MFTESLESVIAPLREELRRREGIVLALLFGSRARGQERDGSDVDVAVEGEDLNVLQLAADLERAVGCEVDVVDLRKVGYPLLKAVLRDGKLIYEGRRGALGRWRSHTIAQLETDRPWFERMRNAFLKQLAERRLVHDGG